MLHPVYGRDEGIQKSTRSHGTNVMMITHDKLSYLIISHLENGRKRNSIAASVQKSCLDNQCYSQWFPSRNTHNFAAAADFNSTWLFSHAKTSKTHLSRTSDFALFIPLIINGLQLSASPVCWPPPTEIAPSVGEQHIPTANVLSEWYLFPLGSFQVSLQIGRIKH